MVDADGNVFIVDTRNYLIRRVDRNYATIRTVVGIDVFAGFADDGGPPTEANLSHPTPVAVDRDGEVVLNEPGCADAISGNGVRPPLHLPPLIGSVGEVCSESISPRGRAAPRAEPRRLRPRLWARRPKRWKRQRRG